MKKSDNTLLTIAIIAVIISGLSLIIAWNNASSFYRVMLGPTGTGTANVTIEKTSEINFTVSLIDWGKGAVLPGEVIDYLDTNSTANPDSSAKGYWNRGFNLPEAGDGGDNGNGGFIIQNIGNSEVIFTVQGPTAASFIGGESPEFGFKISDSDGEPCGTEPANQAWTSFTGGSQATRCDASNPLNWMSGEDAIEMHIHIGVPEVGATGAKSATIVGTAMAV